LEKIEERKFAVVFTTAHSEFALKAFKSDALDYLQKPIDIHELEHAVAKVREKLRSKGESSDMLNTIRKVLGEMGIGSAKDEMSVPTRDGLEIIRFDDILRLEASESYTTIFLCDGRKFISSKTIKVYEDHLPESQFCRVNKAHLINMRHLKGYNRTEGHMAVMRNGDLIPVSRRKLSVLLERIQPF
jgi:two-component system LytT family response regulator